MKSELTKMLNHIITIVQARMNSMRIPNKMILSLAGKPLILRTIERIKKARLTGIVVAALTTEPADDNLSRLLKEEGVDVFRGDPLDLIDRHYKAAIKNDADAIVRIAGNNPLIDPNIIDSIIRVYITLEGKIDYVSNLFPPSYPKGNEVEIISSDMLKYLWKNVSDKKKREAPENYIADKLNRFRIKNILWASGKDYSNKFKFTVDDENDYIFLRRLFEELNASNSSFTLYDVIYLAEKIQNNKSIEKKNSMKIPINNFKTNRLNPNINLNI